MHKKFEPYLIRNTFCNEKSINTYQLNETKHDYVAPPPQHKTTWSYHWQELI